MKQRLCIYWLAVVCSLVSVSAVCALSVPKNERILNDYAGVVNKTHRQKIGKFAKVLQRKTGAEIGVLVIRSLEGEQIDDYATKVFASWKLGQKKKDNGVLLLVSIKDRKIKIEVGYGLEEILTDGICGEILDQMTAFMCNEWYSQGVYVGVVRLINQIATKHNLNISEFPEVQHIKEPSKVSPMTVFFRIIGKLIGLIFFMGLMGARMGLFSYLMLGGARRGYWTSGHRGGFGNSTGFGGFGGFGGGGMSGGGGASRSW